MINKNVIEKLKPCNDRWQNYLKHYGDRSFSHRQFMGLKHITHADKLWVAFQLLPKEKAVLAAADIAESVLHIYENAYPNDSRPRKAIEAARSGDRKAASAAAIAAACNASYAAYAASYAAINAAYDCATAATWAADYAAIAADDRKKQEKLIRTIILKYWR
jgi:hypothetical protein